MGHYIKNQTLNMIFYKIKSKNELNGKIIAMTDNYPDREYVEGGSNPSLWALLDPEPIEEKSYDMFYDLFAEDRQNWIDGDIDIFNTKLKDDDFKTAKIKNIFIILGTEFITLDVAPEMFYLLMVEHRPLPDRPNMSGGKFGYYWTDDYNEKPISKEEIQKTFNLTSDEVDGLMRDCRVIL